MHWVSCQVVFQVFTDQGGPLNAVMLFRNQSYIIRILDIAFWNITVFPSYIWIFRIAPNSKFVIIRIRAIRMTSKCRSNFDLIQGSTDNYGITSNYRWKHWGLRVRPMIPALMRKVDIPSLALSTSFSVIQVSGICTFFTPAVFPGLTSSTTKTRETSPEPVSNKSWNLSRYRICLRRACARKCKFLKYNCNQ